jgi:hypothetical protein
MWSSLAAKPEPIQLALLMGTFHECQWLFPDSLQSLHLGDVCKRAIWNFVARPEFHSTNADSTIANRLREALLGIVSRIQDEGFRSTCSRLEAGAMRSDGMWYFYERPNDDAMSSRELGVDWKSEAGIDAIAGRIVTDRSRWMRYKQATLVAWKHPRDPEAKRSVTKVRLARPASRPGGRASDARSAQ